MEVKAETHKWQRMENKCLWSVAIDEESTSLLSLRSQTISEERAEGVESHRWSNLGESIHYLWSSVCGCECFDLFSLRLGVSITS